jgi:hypothetical protein
MSWKEEVDESSWYTEASKRSFPEDFRLCWLRSSLNNPVDDRKSGTTERVNYWSKSEELLSLTASRHRDPCARDDHDLPLFVQYLEKPVELGFLACINLTQSQVKMLCRPRLRFC